MENTMDGNGYLIHHLKVSGVLQSPSLINAFKTCNRILFVPEEFYPYAYDDRPLPIGTEQTISQPYTVAIMLELLHPRIGDRVLDIGSGSGWTTALLATTVGTSGFVEGVEIIPRLVEYGNENLAKADIHNATITLTDPSILGKPGKLYDCILVSASAHEMPTALIDQLKPQGRLVIPIRNSIWRIKKEKDGTVTSDEFPGFRFVPLIV
ncbi:MAG: protein-L-isoaspartate O-methyltransferase [Sulfuricurvum sp.]|uniref:protein-L-isoaspartate O-methyltransferase family protein n=1 Tax=Sulfuricurvum sp. TaxID=2025608 RepID=UPI00262FE09D|nr:protein-L-isoaspartate O-methyltransferase [Sulfuricurvum sp.]MDD5160590.1 protein-L-isoaspartate O-methyltransferase [Sulfuricurvum sp.]